MPLAVTAELVAMVTDAGTDAATDVVTADMKTVATGVGLSCQSPTTAPSTRRSSSASSVGR
jgi:hypothetical protein